MARRYRVNLYFPCDRTEAALLAVGEMGRAPDGAGACVSLPSGRSVQTPFPLADKGPASVKRRGRGVELAMSLLFPVDEELRSYLGYYVAEVAQSEGDVAVGFIYLSVHVGCRCSELSFRAATSAMSDLFVRSRSVQNGFLDLSRRARGLAGVIFDEKAEGHLLLEDPSKRVRFDYWSFVNEVARSPVDADGLTEVICEALGRPLPKPAVGPTWATWDGGAAMRLARAIQAEGLLADLPILADALLDAGVSDEEVIGHFRYPGEHETDCSLLDHLLGVKSRGPR